MLQGDVYHLVFELGEWLDGRVWPSDDELDVLRMIDFIEHVTGMKPALCMPTIHQVWVANYFRIRCAGQSKLLMTDLPNGCCCCKTHMLDNSFLHAA